MEIASSRVGLSVELGSDPGKWTQWRASLKRFAIIQAPESLGDVFVELRMFFLADSRRAHFSQVFLAEDEPLEESPWANARSAMDIHRFCVSGDH